MIVCILATVPTCDQEMTHCMMILLGSGVFFLSVIIIRCVPPSATLKTDKYFQIQQIFFLNILPTCRGTYGGKTCPCFPTWRSRQSLRCPATLPVGGGRKSASHLSESRSNLGYAKSVVFDNFDIDVNKTMLQNILRMLSHLRFRALAAFKHTSNCNCLYK